MKNWCLMTVLFLQFSPTLHPKTSRALIPFPAPKDERTEIRNQRGVSCIQCSVSVFLKHESSPPILTSNLNYNCHGLLDCFSTPSHIEQKFFVDWYHCIDCQFNSWCRFPSGLFVKKTHIDFLLEGYMKCNHSPYAISCTKIFQRYSYSSIIQFSQHFLSC